MSVQKQFNDFRLRVCFQRTLIDSQIKMLLSSVYLNNFKTACKVHCNRIQNFFSRNFRSHDCWVQKNNYFWQLTWLSVSSPPLKQQPIPTKNEQKWFNLGQLNRFISKLESKKRQSLLNNVSVLKSKAWPLAGLDAQLQHVRLDHWVLWDSYWSIQNQPPVCCVRSFMLKLKLFMRFHTVLTNFDIQNEYRNFTISFKLGKLRTNYAMVARKCQIVPVFGILSCHKSLDNWNCLQ